MGRREGSGVASVARGALALTVALAIPAVLLANGGTLRVANAELGGYLVSVFTDPTPVRPDTLDVSVLVTRAGGREVVQGLDVVVRAEAVEHVAAGRTLRATQEAADDPRYYAAKFSLGTVGRWRITVAVSGEEGGGETSFEVESREPGLLHEPLVLIVVSILPLLLAAWWFLRGAPDRGTPARDRRGLGGRVADGGDA